MRRVRLLLLVFFLVVFAIFMFTSIRDYLTSDYQAPEIQADEDVLYLSVHDATDEALLAGMTATDNLDGDVTDSLVVALRSKFIGTATRNISYAAFDKSNNVGTFVRKLVYTDYHSPHFVISEPLRFVAGNSTYDYLRHVSAVDCLDGNLSSQIKITFGETETTSGSASAQDIFLQVTNSAGDTSSLNLTATFEDYESYSKASPALTDYIIYVRPGQRPNLRSYLNGVWTAGNTRDFSKLGFDGDSDVSIDDSKVDYRNPGVYTATYRLTHPTAMADGGTYRTEFGSATMIIVVEDPS